MAGIFAFMLALNAFGTVLMSQAPQPVWMWALNATVIGGDAAALVFCFYRAKTDALHERLQETARGARKVLRQAKARIADNRRRLAGRKR